MPSNEGFFVTYYLTGLLALLFILLSGSPVGSSPYQSCITSHFQHRASHYLAHVCLSLTDALKQAKIMFCIRFTDGKRPR